MKKNNQNTTTNAKYAINGITHVRGQKKIGRNDPCYCGSGLKFKKCHFEVYRIIQID